MTTAIGDLTPARPLTAGAPPGHATRSSDLLRLTKPRLTLLVVAATLAGFLVAPGHPEAMRLAHVLAGTWLVAAAASAWNQVLERHQDAAMSRTADRPLPAGRMPPWAASAFATTLFTAGTLWLALRVSPLVAGLGVFTTASYTLLYTPLKRRTWLATVVGAVPGAIPPMMGWAAATGGLGAGAWSLFLVLFFWQVPHFLAIATLCRLDYARAGFRVLPVLDPDGRSTARHATLHAAALVPVSLLPAALGLTGPAYAPGALVLGTAYLGLAVRMLAAQDQLSRARPLFRFSLLYLPLLLVLMLV